MPPPHTWGPLRSFKQCKRLPESASVRPFSTTTPHQALGPENPRWIEVPRTRQPQDFPERDVKGTLPPPRKIFPKHAADKKITTEYMAITAPEPQTDRDPRTDFDAWKYRLADQRRTNLREGLTELHARKAKREAQMSVVSSRKNKLRHQLLHAPQPEHERLTADSNSTFELQGLPKGPIPDPNRAERVAQKIARVQAMTEAKAEQRHNALHELYMHARNFITTEQDWQKMVDDEFDAKTLASLGSGGRSHNLWEAYGPPETVGERMNVLNKTQKRIVDNDGKTSKLTRERMQRLAEALTGGKMDKSPVG